MPANLSYKTLFQIDGIGALVTATLLSQVLARWVSAFGMPKEILYVLAGIAGCFALYSLSCYFWLKGNWVPYLKGIAVANTIYCLITLTLVIYLNKSLTWLGIAYFTGEIIIVMALVRLEIKTIITRGFPEN